MSPTTSRRRNAGGCLAGAFSVPVLALCLAAPAAASDRTASETVFDSPPAGEWRTAGLRPDQWLVVDVAGSALTTGNDPAAKAQPVKRRDIIAGGSVLRTGPDGWIKLASGPYRMVLGARSAVALAPTTAPGLSEIEQQGGTLLLDIRGDGERIAQVRTPQLAASAIASSFSIVVGDASASSSVAWGRVAVVPSGTRETSVLASGQTAIVRPGVPERLAADAAGSSSRFRRTRAAAGRPRPSRRGPARGSPLYVRGRGWQRGRR